MELPVYKGYEVDQLIERVQRMRRTAGWTYTFYWLTSNGMGLRRTLWITFVVSRVNKHEAERHAKIARARRVMFSTEK